MSDQSLIVRQHERHALSMSAIVHLAEESVRFSPESGVGADGLRATVTDLSAGGLGLRCGHFLPRKCGLKVIILNERGERAHPLLEASIRVQRVQMVDRAPTYALGCAFINAGPEMRATIETILRNEEAHKSGDQA